MLPPFRLQAQLGAVRIPSLDEGIHEHRGARQLAEVARIDRILANESGLRAEPILGLVDLLVTLGPRASDHTSNHTALTSHNNRERESVRHSHANW